LARGGTRTKALFIVSDAMSEAELFIAAYKAMA
jgi:hypothetical protein